MEKIEKTRKTFKLIQYIGMGVIIAVGMFLIYWFGIRNSKEFMLSNTITYIMLTIIALFFFVTFVSIPMQAKLLKLIIIESLEGLVTELTFNKKKGYSRESFEKLHICASSFSNYGCTDYYSFNYNGMTIESTTARAYDEIKVQQKKKNGLPSKKVVRQSINHFHGRIYLIPMENEIKLNIYGKKNASASRKNELADYEYNQELPIKVKKQQENFEVFYQEGNKPNPAFMSNVLDKLMTLRLQAKGPVSLFVRKSTMVLLIDNGKFYKEEELKNPIDERIIRDYRKDVSMVLNFISALKKDNQ